MLRRVPMTNRSSPLRLLVLFQGNWEDEALFSRVRAGELVLEREGFELLDRRHWPRLLHFDARRYAKKLCETYRGRVDAVWSNDDGFGCLLAAVVARRLGLPGTDPAAIVRAQHKVLLREVLAAAAPDVSVPCMALPYAFGDRRCRDVLALDAALARAGHAWPRFCKPVKGVFSALAARVSSAAELAAHLRRPLWDRVTLRGLARPFEQLARDVAELPCSVDRLLLEEPLEGAQVNVDGYVASGEPRVLGIVDEWMYEQEHARARHFAGFTYPSRHPEAAQRRIRDAALKAVRALGLQHGLFNVELFLLADGSVRIIEVNPRGAGQFASIYRDVDGIDMEGIAIALAAGHDPEAVPRTSAVAGAAGSFAFRRFDGQAGPAPDPAGLAWLATEHPRARLWLDEVDRRSLRREYRWHGSHRHAVWNASASDLQKLLAMAAECGRRLFGSHDQPWSSEPVAVSPQHEGSARGQPR